MLEKKSLEIIAKDRDLPIGTKVLYLYILSIENEKYPSRSKIAFDLNISNVTLGKYLKQLTKNGYLKCEQSKINGRFGTNYYTT